MLYGVWPDGYDAVLDLLAGVAMAVLKDPSPDGIAAFQQELNQIKQLRDEFEDRFARFMTGCLGAYDLTDPAVRKALGKTLADPAAEEIAGTTAVLRARELLGLVGEDPELADRARSIREQFPTPTRLHLYKLHQIVTSGLDITAPNKRNSVWDIDIAYCVGQTAGQHPPLLVTTDKDLLRAAGERGQGSAVEPLHSYLRRLGMATH